MAGGHGGTVGRAHARAGAEAPTLALVRWGGREACGVGTHGPEQPRGLHKYRTYPHHAMLRLFLNRPEARISPKGIVCDYSQEIDLFFFICAFFRISFCFDRRGALSQNRPGANACCDVVGHGHVHAAMCYNVRKCTL